MNQRKFNSVDDALGTVQREIQPTRDLWPLIARELPDLNDPKRATPADLAAVREARRMRAVRVPWPLAMAASLGVVSLVAALCWSVIQQRGSAPLSARTTSAIPGNTPVSFGPPQNAAYMAASAALEHTFDERLKLLAPATKARVQADLETIHRANEDLRKALAQDPASPLLLQLLHSTWQQEIDLYTSVAQSTEPLLMRRT
ncbi:MAG TPA: hypothetical protein VGN77_09075 [Steroidobacteraceae bacterium]|nr:hypothetical protein [Steroidobacteraceae bacterium]